MMKLGDPIQNDRRVKIIFIITLILICMTPPCMFIIILKDGA